MIRTAGVVGAGTMGLGIAQVCAMSGLDTILYDISLPQLEKAINEIERNLLFLVSKGKISADEKSLVFSRIRTTHVISDLRADLIIEAALEKLEIKQDLFANIEKINEGKAILASNTSSISITKISQGLKDKSRCIGLHFFNPADRMKLVEIITSEYTDPALVTALQDFALKIEKTAVLAKDSPGFIVNRVARHYYVESLKLLEEKAAGIETIDALLKASGFKMGPFELMDLIGVDTNLAVTTSIYNGFEQNPKFKPSVIQQQLVKEGNMGRKTGKGFYNY